jgi:serine/threonine protein kinase
VRIPGVDEAFVLFAGQDSGCLSYGAVAEGRRWFVKVPRTAAARASLRRAVTFHAAVRHPAIVRPVLVADEGEGPTLLYPWVEGAVLNAATVAGSDRAALARFRSRPVSAVLRALDNVLDAHLAVAGAGFVAVDLYDGSFLYDFTADRLHLIDLDEYRPGPFVVAGDRLPGARSYMAPEELRRGATIDERTTVFDLGRTLLHLLAPPGAGGSGATRSGVPPWRGTAAQSAVVDRATRLEPGNRYGSVAELVAAWRAATGDPPVNRDNPPQRVTGDG